MESKERIGNGIYRYKGFVVMQLKHKHGCHLKWQAYNAEYTIHFLCGSLNESLARIDKIIPTPKFGLPKEQASLVTKSLCARILCLMERPSNKKVKEEIKDCESLIESIDKWMEQIKD